MRFFEEKIRCSSKIKIKKKSFWSMVLAVNSTNWDIPFSKLFLNYKIIIVLFFFLIH